MKKVMSILTVAAFFVGVAGIVSFTVAEKKSNQTTAWFYVNAAGNPDLTEGPQSEASLNCEYNEIDVCAREFNLSPAPPHNPTTPTGAPDLMGEKQ